MKRKCVNDSGLSAGASEKVIKVLSALVCIFSLVIAGLCYNSEKVDAAASSSSIYSSVESAYGSKYPLSSSNEITTSRKNVFGGYSSVLGVSCELFSEYKAAKKSNSKYQYVSFVCKATSSSNVSKIKKKLKAYVKNEKTGNQNYYNSKGKKLLNNAKIGAKGDFVYLFILDTSKNSKAISAFNSAA
ncbi:MAG: DUF4358 domain-containing protein [Lachnospiraceae bacterium]|nr:DUF4358 domain-containing protein [Lachnospiraceae bacterium]